ncbi:MAG: flagellar biosynthesis protein FliH [Sphingomonas bacterium]|uniref:FliH/SctL family protein n=1 Tax=Sphingomonas bacterium TaxID=1895847 RepID=UPI002634C8CC|nr:FliH/SctL family protein [Sphingomonas bacterium]MDB5706658.1 flagellar biosynthesis protein FliH [Sphingomonas bacterium]
MSDFTAGFVNRHEAVAQALQQAFDVPPEAFAPADLKAWAVGRNGPVSFSPQSDGPRHFHPADPATNPTEGWDPFAAADAAPAASFVDPIATAHAAGFAEGMATAIAEIGETGDRDRALLAELGEALRSDGRLDRERMARQLRQTVMFLVSRLIGEVGIAPDILARRIESAAEMLADSAESALLRVHPDDVALLDGKLPKTVFAVGDASVARGSFVLESASTIVEDGPELWLEQLAQAIDRVAVPNG